MVFLFILNIVFFNEKSINSKGMNIYFMCCVLLISVIMLLLIVFVFKIMLKVLFVIKINVIILMVVLYLLLEIKFLNNILVRLMFFFFVKRVGGVCFVVFWYCDNLILWLFCLVLNILGVINKLVK